MLIHICSVGEKCLSKLRVCVFITLLVEISVFFLFVCFFLNDKNYLVGFLS